ncbi:MAG: hypothetical protein Q7O66_20415 [Dehalococcoidia bacterium]|nr:hypothetical protein [Dehalococcoidia bacterium]
MTRVDELQKKYPTIPRQYIIRWDCKAHGIADTGTLDELGMWVPNVGSGTYASYDHDITLKDWVDLKPGRQKPGYA